MIAGHVPRRTAPAEQLILAAPRPAPAERPTHRSLPRAAAEQSERQPRARRPAPLPTGQRAAGSDSHAGLRLGDAPSRFRGCRQPQRNERRRHEPVLRCTSARASLLARVNTSMRIPPLAGVMWRPEIRPRDRTWPAQVWCARLRSAAAHRPHAGRCHRASHRRQAALDRKPQRSSGHFGRPVATGKGGWQPGKLDALLESVRQPKEVFDRAAQSPGQAQGSRHRRNQPGRLDRADACPRQAGRLRELVLGPAAGLTEGFDAVIKSVFLS